MDHDIVSFISRHISLSEEEIAYIDGLQLLRKFPKDSILLAEGSISQECYLVLQGCIRTYYLIDGEEKTTAFFTENQVATPLSYHNGQPSAYYLSCLEETIVCVGDKGKTKDLLHRIPRLEHIGHILNSALVQEHQQAFDAYKTQNAEQRYLRLLDQRPALCQRVPQYLLASYLGIKPETLSRIRRRLMTHDS